MPPLASPWWIGSAAVYLEFSSVIGWLMSAILALAFLPAHGSSPEGRGRLVVWPVMAVGFTAICIAAVVTLLDHTGLIGAPGADPLRWSRPAVGFGVVALLAAATPPHRAMHRGAWIALVLAVGATPVIWSLFRAGDARAAVVLIHGGLGAWLLAAPSVRARGIETEIPSRAVGRILGGTILGVSLTCSVSALVADWPGRELPRALVFALVAWTTFGTLWCAYLREHTLPPLRDRPGGFGLRPAHLLPLLQVGMLIVGMLAIRDIVYRAESFAASRLLTELRAVIRTLASERPLEASAGAVATTGRFRTTKDLNDLVASSPSYRAALLWTWGDTAPGAARAGILAASDAPRALPDLLPRVGAELNATAAAQPYVRWTRPMNRQGIFVVMLPLSPPTPAPTPFVSIAVEAQDLGDMIAAQRLQGLAIVGLLVLIAGITVLTVVRSGNERELRALKEQAERENQARNELFAMVSHEVRTPLQSVLGHAELTATEALPPGAIRHVQAIRAQGAALLRIVQDILDLSALRSGRLRHQPEPVALRLLAEGVRQAFADRAVGKGLVLEVTVEQDVPAVVLVDRVRLDQVLANLVGNAIKFTAQGGVRLLVMALPPTGEPARVRLEFRIEDTGPGIPAPQLRYVFEPFRTLPQGTTSGGGAGLGLAVCQEIVASLGGKIAVESREGSGTTFRVRLDLPTASALALAYSPTATPETSLSPPEAGALAGLRVLLVEDHPLVRDLLSDFLHRLEANVSARADGASALEAMQDTAFDVVLLDLILPDFTVDAMLVALRRHARSPVDPWIVGLSAGATEHQIQHALEHGMNDFLLKPVSMAGLVETLRLSPAGTRIKVPDLSAAPAAQAPSDPRAPTLEERATLEADMAPTLRRLERACAAGDGDTLVTEAHFLANSLLLLARPDAHRLSRQIEDAAREGDFTAARSALAALAASMAPADWARAKA